jgi:hypothetical protein
MTVDDALQAFETAGNVLPEEAMRWTLDHWDEAAPRFLALLDAYANGDDRSQATAEKLLFITHLLGEKGETRAFPDLAKLLRDDEALVALLDEDGAVESLPGMLIKCFDGDPGPLQAAIEDPNGDPVNSGTALLVMAYLARTGRLTHDEMRSYLLHLFDTLPKKPDTDLMEDWRWGAWVGAIAALGYTDLVPRVEAVFKQRLISPMHMVYEDFQGDLRQTLDDPEGMALFEDDHMVPLDDAIGSLAKWHMFSPDTGDDDAEREVGDELAFDDDTDAPLEAGWKGPADKNNRFFGGGEVAVEQRVNPFRNVGRNDLGPCGSGKKFKKCCLGSV